MWHYYYVWFEQENYPTNDGFVSIVGGKWCTDEEEAIREVERCCKNWNR
jgi:glycerol-3-phosphate dehydrogenase